MQNVNYALEPHDRHAYKDRKKILYVLFLMVLYKTLQKSPCRQIMHRANWTHHVIKL